MKLSIPVAAAALAWVLAIACCANAMRTVAAEDGDSSELVRPESLPAAPTGLRASVANNRLELRWKDNSRDEEAFHVEMSPTGRDLWGEIGVYPAGTNFQSVALPPPPRGGFDFRVRARNGRGFSDYSEVVSIAPLASAPPAPAATKEPAVAAKPIASIRLTSTARLKSGASLSFTFRDAPANAGQWVALARQGSPVTVYRSRKEVAGPDGSGSLSIAPGPAGQYVLRLMKDRGYVPIAESAPFSIR